MKIEDVRHLVGMSQQKFANYFGIPVGTLRNWEQGIASPPQYVFTMIFQIIRRDKMINIETLKFSKMLDELAEKSKNGIEKFENATSETFYEKIFYDEEFDCKVVQEACIIDDEDCIHHDIIAFYEGNEYSIHVELVDDEEPFVLVKMLESNEEIVIENGEWYFT